MAMKTHPIINTSLALVIAVTLFISCAGTPLSKVVVSPDYKKHPLINATLALVIKDAKPEVIYHGSVQRAFGRGDAEELARRFFLKGLLNDLSKEVDLQEAFALSELPNYLITKEEVNRENEIVSIEIPMAGTKFELGSNKRVDLILILSNIRIGTQTDEHYHSRVDYGINTRIGRHLIYISNFVLWDNRTQSLICYGRVKSRVPIRGADSVISEWEEVSKQFIRTIFEPTGFLKRSKNR